MERLTLFSSTGTKIAYGCWIAALALSVLLAALGVGPGVWIDRFQQDSFGRVSMRLTFVILTLGTTPVWLLAGGLWDLATRQGLFEREPDRPRRRRRRGLE